MPASSGIVWNNSARMVQSWPRMGLEENVLFTILEAFSLKHYGTSLEQGIFDIGRGVAFVLRMYLLPFWGEMLPNFVLGWNLVLMCCLEASEILAVIIQAVIPILSVPVTPTLASWPHFLFKSKWYIWISVGLMTSPGMSTPESRVA